MEKKGKRMVAFPRMQRQSRQSKMTKEQLKQLEADLWSAADNLLRRLQENDPRVFVTDWFKDAQSRSHVRSAVESVLHTHLPESYDRVLFRKKVDNVFTLMVDYASQGAKWVV